MASEPTTSHTPRADEPHRLEQQRRENRDKGAAIGFDPYGGRRDGLISLGEALRRYDADADEAHKAAGKAPLEGYTDRRPVVSIAGRVVLHRDNGKLIWLNLRDATGDLQVAVSQRDCDEKGFALAKEATDLGDVVFAAGPLVKTKTGEVTVWASALEPAAKCLMPPPEKHAGLQDVEQRYRRRYVDLWATPETMRVFRHRSRILSRTRRFLDERRFLEVETPVLQQLAGGAAARPFITHMNALNIELFLRVAPELYLKRLLVGGMPRVYEIARNFRNEGLDRTHNPEFTMLEVYEAFGDYMTMLELTESLIRELATMVVVQGEDESGAPGPEDALPSELLIAFGESSVDYGSPFAQVTYGALFQRALGCDMFDAAAVRKAAESRLERTKNEKGEPYAHELLVQELFERFAEPLIDPAKPTFVMDYPAALCPLTRQKAGRPEVAERFELYIAGMEVANAYTELNDPDVQERRFREQLAGIGEEESTFRTFDQDFIDALKVGMPPAGGLGVGMDRIIMLLTGQRTIRDVLLFPMMRPLA